MARVKTFSNGGRIFPSDLNGIQDDYNSGFGAWKVFAERSSERLIFQTAANPRILGLGSSVIASTANDADAPGPALINFDVDDLTFGGRTIEAKIRAWVVANPTAPGVNFTFSLRGASVLGTGTTGYLGLVATSFSLPSAAVAATTLVAGINQVDSAVFTPTANFFVFYAASSGTQASGSTVALHAQLMYRYV